MAVTRKGYVYGVVFSSGLCVLVLVIVLATDSWVLSTATDNLISADSHFRYGLFRGELELNNLATPTYSTLYMTCLFDIGACAVSCKTTPEAREAEVRALANSSRPNPACVAITTVDYSNPLEGPATISSTIYVLQVVLVSLQLLSAAASTCLAIYNVPRNPIEPMFGLPGCLIANAVTAVLGLVALLMFGIYYVTSGWKEHLAFSYIANGLFVPSPGLGFSYWLLIAAILCSLTSVGLIEIREYLLEKDPPPPTIKVENHSDGTIFLY